MSQTAQKFVHRAPRYMIRPKDEAWVRFAIEGETSKPVQTQFLNLSSTGLAFVVPQSQMPLVGELIKVEFPIPGNGPIAWFAKVVRIEEYQKPTWRLTKDEIQSPQVVVGVRFEELPEGHRSSIIKALDEKFVDVLREQRIQYGLGLLRFASQNMVRVCIYITLTVLLGWLLWSLSRPSENYDRFKGSPWGQRFK